MVTMNDARRIIAAAPSDGYAGRKRARQRLLGQLWLGHQVAPLMQCRITSVTEQGRKQYRVLQLIQLMIWNFEVMPSVWRSPPYRWSQRPRRVLRACQLSLFDGFAQ